MSCSKVCRYNSDWIRSDLALLWLATVALMTSSLGTFIWCGCCPKMQKPKTKTKTKPKKKKTEKKNKQIDFIYIVVFKISWIADRMNESKTMKK